MPENPKLLKVSVLGVPNSGKSTLVNRLMNRRVSAVSSKINTTRNRLTAVLTDQDSQLVNYLNYPFTHLSIFDKNIK
jgi:GTPase Era involved in 16S rRNA processing